MCDLGTISILGGTSFTINVVVDCPPPGLPGALTNIAVVSADSIDTNLTNNTVMEVITLSPLLVTFTNMPGWWTNRGILTGAAVDDWAAAVQGQVKFIAFNAYDELNTVAPCGAGTHLSTIIGSFDKSFQRGLYGGDGLATEVYRRGVLYSVQ